MTKNLYQNGRTGIKTETFGKAVEHFNNSKLDLGRYVCMAPKFNSPALLTACAPWRISRKLRVPYRRFRIIYNIMAYLLYYLLAELPEPSVGGFRNQGGKGLKGGGGAK